MDSLVLTRDASSLAAMVVKLIEPEAAADLLWAAANHAEAYATVKAGGPRAIPRHITPKAAGLGRLSKLMLLVGVPIAMFPSLREAIASRVVVLVLRVWVWARNRKRQLEAKSIKDSGSFPTVTEVHLLASTGSTGSGDAPQLQRARSTP